MAVEIPHFDVPLRFVDGAAAVVDQDTEDEIVTCVASLLVYPLGSRLEAVDFGVEEQAFEQGGPSADEIRGALRRYEPRAHEMIEMDDAALLEFVGRVRIDLGAAVRS